MQAMVSAFDRVVIAVPGLVEAGAQYGDLLGMKPAPVALAGVSRLWFPVPNTVIELVESDAKHAHIRGLVLGAAAAGDIEKPVTNALGLDIALANGSRTAGLRELCELGDGSVRVDHLVLRTADAAACIDLFGRQLGIRLALDQTVPEWGGRMLFFRTGKMTLEVIEPLRERPAADYFWGIAYQCPDLQETARVLAGRGVSLSGIRAGRKPGSLVATVKSHCLGIPTLLLQP